MSLRLATDHENWGRMWEHPTPPAGRPPYPRAVTLWWKRDVGMPHSPAGRPLHPYFHARTTKRGTSDGERGSQESVETVQLWPVYCYDRFRGRGRRRVHV